jgi:hypothetical protein
MPSPCLSLAEKGIPHDLSVSLNAISLPLSMGSQIVIGFISRNHPPGPKGLTPRQSSFLNQDLNRFVPRYPQEAIGISNTIFDRGWPCNHREAITCKSGRGESPSHRKIADGLSLWLQRRRFL